MPVYVSSNKSLYIGHYQFSSNLWQRVLNLFSIQDQFQRIQQKLMTRLASTHEHEMRAEQICNQLNALVGGDNDGRKCFPLHVPWLSEGRAFGAVHPSALAAFPGNGGRLCSILQRGTVRGARATRAGNARTCVETTHDPYKDVDGRKHTTSNLKIKDTDLNARIFGRRIPDAGPAGEILYYFDGPGKGH